LSRKSRLNDDASLTSKVFVTSICVGGHVANPINTTDSSALEFALPSLTVESVLTREISCQVGKGPDSKNKCGITQDDEPLDNMTLQQYLNMYKEPLAEKFMEAILKLT
jgi:hypothetical protein